MEEMYRDGPDMVFLRTPGSPRHDHVERRTRERDQAGRPGGVGHFGFRLKADQDLGDAIRKAEAAGGRLVERGEHAPGVVLRLHRRSRRQHHRAVRDDRQLVAIRSAWRSISQPFTVARLRVGVDAVDVADARPVSHVGVGADRACSRDCDPLDDPSVVGLAAVDRAELQGSADAVVDDPRVDGRGGRCRWGLRSRSAGWRRARSRRGSPRARGRRTRLRRGGRVPWSRVRARRAARRRRGPSWVGRGSVPRRSCSPFLASTPKLVKSAVTPHHPRVQRSVLMGAAHGRRAVPAELDRGGVPAAR